MVAAHRLLRFFGRDPSPPPALVTLVTLNFRYRLWPTPQQESALGDSMAVARRAWNSLVALRQHALDQCRRGREADIRRELIALDAAKKPVGMRAAKLRRLAAEHGEEGARLRLQAEVQERVWALGRSRLIKEFAVARAAQAKNRKVGDAMGAMWWQVADAFGLACEALKPGRRLRYRRRDESAPLRVQHQRGLPIRERADGEHFVDLGALLPAARREALRWCRYEAHRPLPEGARVKRIALTQDRTGWHVVLTIDVPRDSVAKQFPSTGRTAGVDPGRTIALTVAPADSKTFGQHDGIELRATRGQGRLLRRVARLARKADRQRRANNPDCYREDGSAIKGQRPRKTSRKLDRTRDQLAELHRQFAARRTEFYHLAAGELLRRFDVVQIGNWTGLPGAAAARARNAALIAAGGSRRRPPKPKAPRPKGSAARVRGQRRKDAGNALAEFKRVAREKAALSTTSKTIVEISEHGSTRTCPRCAGDTGPRGVQSLGQRRWECSVCATEFFRDRAAAYQLATRPREHAADAGGDGAPRRSKARPQRARLRAVAGQREAATSPTHDAALRERSGADESLGARSRGAPSSEPDIYSDRSPARPRSAQPPAGPSSACTPAHTGDETLAVPG